MTTVTVTPETLVAAVSDTPVPNVRTIIWFAPQFDPRILAVYPCATQLIIPAPITFNLDVISRLMFDLSGIESCPSLEIVRISASYIADVGPLTRLPKLRELAIINNRCDVMNLELLANCSVLEKFHFLRPLQGWTYDWSWLKTSRIKTLNVDDWQHENPAIKEWQRSNQS